MFQVLKFVGCFRWIWLGSSVWFATWKSSFKRSDLFCCLRFKWWLLGPRKLQGWFLQKSFQSLKNQNWLPERQKIKFDFAWLQHPVGINTIMCTAFISQKKINHFTVWPQPIWIRVNCWWQILPQHQSTYIRGPESVSIEIPPYQTKIYLLSKSSSKWECYEVRSKYFIKNSFWKFYEVRSERGDFNWYNYRFWASWVPIYFDPVVVEVKTFLFYSYWLWPFCV